MRPAAEMRSHGRRSRPRITCSRPAAAAAALLTTVAVAISGCSGPQIGEVTPPPASQTAPRTTAAPAPRTTPPRQVPPIPLARSLPVRLQIASIGVDTALMDLGLNKDGSLQVPVKGFPAGWYTGGPTPGELGPAVIAGHIDMNGPAVFYRLSQLKPGDQVTVRRADGSKPVFRVTRVSEFNKDRFPTALVYGDLDHPGLRLITCGGTFDQQSGHYEDNLVVFADLVSQPR